MAKKAKRKKSAKKVTIAKGKAKGKKK